MDNSTELTIEGMNCVNCARGVENVLRRVGVENPVVDFATETARFSLRDGLTLERISGAIEAAGYRVASSRSKGPPWWRSLEAKFMFSLLWSLPLFAHMFLDIHLLHQGWFQLLLCTPVFLLGLTHFGSSAVSSIRAGAANMDVLIIIGVIAAYLYSLTGYLFNLGSDYLFFETSATIVSIVLFGNLLEKRAIRRTTSALGELSLLQRSIAHKVVVEGSHETLVELDASMVEVDDILQVNTGDRVPTDGVVLKGDAAIDESMLSGESVPVPKSCDDKVIGGSLVVQGSIRIKVVSVGEHTVLSQIIALVRDAQGRKPAIQQLGDRVSAIFVPAVSVFAVLTFIVSATVAGLPLGQALLHAIAVLVVACPCAMGLATPTAVMVGIGKAANRGILLRGGNILEELAHVRTMAFDKTGTLTTGDFTIGPPQTFNFSAAEAQSIIVALERASSHPIARSILKNWHSVVPSELRDIREERGFGVSGRDTDGNLFEVTSSRNSNTPLTQGFDLVLLKNRQAVAAVKLSDTLKAEAKTALADLSHMGITLAMVSGDSQEKCSQLSATLGISEVYAQQLPEQKLEVLRSLEQRSPTGYVGDGINDAPALAIARVGISLSNASQVAVQSAQVVLLNGNLSSLVAAVRIARKTLRTIKQNLFWAFFYNILMIPLAAAGYLRPDLAALSMAFSDVVIILNSLRLKLTPTSAWANESRS